MVHKRYRFDIQVRFRDTDGLGHINNAVYHSYIEMSRSHWLDTALGYKIFTTGDHFPLILARTEMDYLRQAYLHNAIYVESYITHIGHKSFHQVYEIHNGQELIAKAKAILVWFDYTANQSVAIPEEKRRLMQEYLQEP